MSSDEENEVVLPVPDSMSDGDESTWRLNDPQFQYRMIDDTRWRVALAQMWIEKTGAVEKGMLNQIPLFTLLTLLPLSRSCRVCFAFWKVANETCEELVA